MKTKKFLIIGLLELLVFLFFVGTELFNERTGLWLYAIPVFLNGIAFLVVNYKIVKPDKLLNISYFLTLIPIILFLWGIILTTQQCSPSSQMGCIFPLIITLIFLSCCSLLSLIMTTIFFFRARK